MAPPPPEVVQWLKRAYPKPSVDPEWLEGCYTWIADELRLNPARDMPTILENVNTQLLESDFADSMVAGTGIPQDALGAVHTVIKGPILVEIVDMMDIGHGAYSLLQVYESRAEYRKQAALREAAEDQDDEQQKPMPKYPRSMLQFQLSDGVSVLSAIEHKSLPEFVLGETPLGYKMIIKNVTIRRGTALLEPQCIELKGHRTADRDEKREETLLRALKRRLGEDEEPAPAPVQDDHPAPPPPYRAPPAPAAQAPAPARVPAPAAQPTPTRAPAPAPSAATPPRLPRLNGRSPARGSRSPLRGIPLPLEPKAGPSNAVPLNMDEHADDADEPRRRKVPNRAGRSPSPDPPPRAQRSRYFPANTINVTSSTSTHGNGASSSGKVTLRGPGTADAMKEFARTVGLSPPCAPPIEIPDSDEEDDLYAPPRPTRSSAATQPTPTQDKQKQKSTQKKPIALAAEPSSDDFGFGSEFEMDASFFEEINRAEEEALKRDRDNATAVGSTQTQTQTRTQVQSQTLTRTHVKTEVQSQATTSTLVNTSAVAPTARGSSTVRNTPVPSSRATSMPGPSSSGQKGQVGANNMDVIDIDDDEDGEKENVPIPTRHVRRRIAAARRMEESEVIELSD